MIPVRSAISQYLLEMLQIEDQPSEQVCDKKDKCCKSFKKGKRCKKCPDR